MVSTEYSKVNAVVTMAYEHAVHGRYNSRQEKRVIHDWLGTAH